MRLLNSRAALLLAFLVLFMLSACRHGNNKSEVFRFGDNELAGLEQREDFLMIFSELIEGQEKCRFSPEVLGRITFGEPGEEHHYFPSREECIYGVRVTSVHVDQYSGVSIFLSGKRNEEYYLQAVLDEKDRWVFYWPELVRKNGLH